MANTYYNVLNDPGDAQGKSTASGQTSASAQTSAADQAHASGHASASGQSSAADQAHASGHVPASGNILPRIPVPDCMVSAALPTLAAQTMARMAPSIIRDTVLSDEFIDFMKVNTLPIETMMTYYECAIMEIETKFKVLNEQFSLSMDRNPIESIKSRVKSFDSIVKKVRKKNVPLDLDSIESQIRDIAGVRVICSFPDDIYMLADCLLQQDDITLIERKDYIKNPKPSGYRSLHLIVEVPIFLKNEKRPVKVEVQLRTIAMDFWASLEHKLRYKKNIPADEAQLLAEELLSCAEESSRLDARMQEIRNKIAGFEDEKTSWKIFGN